MADERRQRLLALWRAHTKRPRRKESEWVKAALHLETEDAPPVGPLSEFEILADAKEHGTDDMELAQQASVVTRI